MQFSKKCAQIYCFFLIYARKKCFFCIYQKSLSIFEGTDPALPAHLEITAAR